MGGAQPRGNFPLYLLHPPPPPANRSWYRKMKFVIVGAVLASLPGGTCGNLYLAPQDHGWNYEFVDVNTFTYIH